MRLKSIHLPAINAEQLAKEHEDFAYIVSHDLNAPLRHVKEFTRLLIGSRQDNLTEEEREYVGFLEKSLQKLDEMQGALLAFSRLNTRAGPLKEVDLSLAVPAALKEQKDLRESGPVLECGKLPVIMAEPRQIQMVFQNLISNALKFHEDDTSGKQAYVGAEDKGDVWMFEVRDNGIGIAQEHHEEIFRLFRRLEPDRYTGIGAGLTIARKITRRHGGEMSVQSRKGYGTSIFFSIAKEIPSG
jgi:light-regulated signal transduction histidine kinase (bacteriophytochrome)